MPYFRQDQKFCSSYKEKIALVGLLLTLPLVSLALYDCHKLINAQSGNLLHFQFVFKVQLSLSFSVTFFVSQVAVVG